MNIKIISIKKKLFQQRCFLDQNRLLPLSFNYTWRTVEALVLKTDIEKADMEREKQELIQMSDNELNTLAQIYEKRG